MDIKEEVDVQDAFLLDATSQYFLNEAIDIKIEDDLGDLIVTSVQYGSSDDTEQETNIKPTLLDSTKTRPTMTSKRSIKDYFSTTIRSLESKKRKIANNETEQEEEIDENEDENGTESTDRSSEHINEPSTSSCNVEQARNNWSQFPTALDLSKTPHDPPSQPILREYPVTKIAIENKAFCFYCRFFHKADVKEKPFIIGYNKWKKAMESNSGFTAIAHKECLVGFREFQRSSSVGGVESLIKNKNNGLIEENPYYIKTLAEILLLTCKLEITQREHDKSRGSANRGNFLELTEFIANHDPVFKKKISSAGGNAKYLHSSIQNELLEILSNEVLQSGRDEIAEAKFYSVLADETKDLLKKEQMSTIVSHNYIVSIISCLSDYLQSKEMDYARANTLVEEVLQQLQLMRDQSSYWDAIWERVDKLWTVTGDSSEVVPKRKKQLPARG
ncbi:unnamed protein product [Ceutorhynchus assimilis]|uniref:DUF4371 domain-containing protein n=1 Tax=Ceutorhynchus assimilis TaxID=467358 RepID=A0A9N9MDI6_9CUCU|nr:unnamed protein product [Ceutorhynchus assimilis]